MSVETRRRARMTQSVRLTSTDLAVIRDSLTRTIDGIYEATKPFGLTSTWDAATRVVDARSTITEAICALRRRQYPDWNPVLDRTCRDYATDADWDRLTDAERAQLDAEPTP